MELKELKEINPVEVAEYVTARQIADEVVNGTQEVIKLRLSFGQHVETIIYVNNRCYHDYHLHLSLDDHRRHSDGISAFEYTRVSRGKVDPLTWG